MITGRTQRLKTIGLRDIGREPLNMLLSFPNALQLIVVCVFLLRDHVRELFELVSPSIRVHLLFFAIQLGYFFHNIERIC